MNDTSLYHARADIATLVDALKADDKALSPHQLLDLLTKAVEERSDTLVVTITTPSGDSGTLKDTVQKAIEKKTGKKVMVRDVADKAVIGGAVICYGDERIDLSLDRALQDAQQLLASSLSPS